MRGQLGAAIGPTINAVGDIGRVPVSEFRIGSMHLFSVSAGGQSLRFMI